MLPLAATSCSDIKGLDAGDPARGPGQLVGNGGTVSDGNYRGGADALPPPRDVEPPADDLAIDCNGNCQSYCDGLGLQNPVNAGICRSLWGVGLQTRPIDRLEACRRLYADFVGRYPNQAEVDTVCAAPTWGETVKQLQATDEYVLVNQRRWADLLLYNNRAVNFERAYDMDELVGKAYRGRVSWDQFAAVTSAHPILVRRHDTAGDRAAFLFELFLGRPPYESERADIARLYRLWNNGYWDHPYLGRLPDAFVEYQCVDENGQPNVETVGECTSILWGHNELTLRPDPDRVEPEGDQQGMLWSGFLLPHEWEKLQLPGRIIASEPAFWEHAADDALTRYLGYNVAIDEPAVRHELVKYILEYGGDIRALDFAITTSFLYLQSSKGEANPRRWTYGPLKQIVVEGWLDSIAHATALPMARCDHRLPHPEDYVGDEAEEEGMGLWAYALVNKSRWVVDGEREVDFSFRNLARTLGGCPSNEVGGRFTSVSVLNTAVQESFVSEVCGISGDQGIPVERLLPGIAPNTVLDENTATAILSHQQLVFLNRGPDDEELEEARFAASQCPGCDAAAFARPLCFALLSSSEMLFY